MSFQISAENTAFSVLFSFFEMMTFKIYFQQLSNMQYSIANCSTHCCTLHPHVMEWGWNVFCPPSPISPRCPLPSLASGNQPVFYEFICLVSFSLPSFIYLVLLPSFTYFFSHISEINIFVFFLLTDFNQNNVLRFKSKVMEEICHGICPIFVIII